MIEQVMSGIAHGVGHPLMIPLSLTGVFCLYALVGVDVANIAISILTLAVLPIIQHSQNRDGAAIQAKLDVLIKGVPEADDRYIGLDRKTEKEIEHERFHPGA